MKFIACIYTVYVKLNNIFCVLIHPSAISFFPEFDHGTVWGIVYLEEKKLLIYNMDEGSTIVSY